MAVLPVQRTWTVGEKVTAAMLNDDVRDAVNFLLNPPSVSVSNGAIAVANSTNTYATFTSEQYDTDAMHSTSTNTSRLTCTLAGVYEIFGSNTHAGAAGGYRSSLVRLNGATVLRQVDIPATGLQQVVPLGQFAYKLALNDYLEWGMHQNSGAALNVTPSFGMRWTGVG